MAINNDGQVLAGLYDLANVQDRLRIYAQNKQYFQFWALRQINTITLLKIISEKFGTVPGQQVADWVVRYPQFNEIAYQFYLSEASNVTDASNTLLKVTNDIAATLNTSIRLHVDGIYCKAVVVDATTDMAATRNIASGIYLPEELRITNVGNPDGGGAGYTIVTVRRAHPADTYANTAPAITTSMHLTVSNLVTRANDYPKPPINKNSDYQENYVQITRASYGLGEHMTQGGGVETYLANGTDQYLNISYMLAETFLMKAMERALIVGRKSQKKIGNDLEFESGGIIEFIQNDSDHIIDLGGKIPTVQRMNNLVRRMADISGIKELWLFTGTHYSEQIANAYENKSVYYTNGDLSLKYQMKIMTLESVGRDMTVQHVTTPILNELGLASGGLALNLTEYNYGEKNPFGSFQIAHKVPFADQPDDAASYKSNEGYKGKWRELYGAWTLVRRLPDTHFMLLNAAEPVNA